MFRGVLSNIICNIILKLARNTVENDFVVGSRSQLDKDDLNDYEVGKALSCKFLRAWIREDYQKVYAMLCPNCRFKTLEQKRAWYAIEMHWRQYGVVYTMNKESKEMSSVKFSRRMSLHDKKLIRSMDDMKCREVEIIKSIRLVRNKYKQEDLMKLLLLSLGTVISEYNNIGTIIPDKMMLFSFQMYRHNRSSVLVLVKDKGRWYHIATPGQLDFMFDKSFNIIVQS